MTEEQIISPEQLVELQQIGFKLVPLGDDFKPSIKWTPVYDNPDYWTPEKLTQEASLFKKGVATVFGKSRISDEKGCLYLHGLDVDSKEAYNILFNLAHGDRRFSLIAEAIKSTYVTKTRRPNGFHIYWLSHTQHESIFKKDCKAGCEFEIKAGKGSGHSTLPPSPHRDDVNFNYKAYGQQKLLVSDDMYDRLIEVLRSCLKENNNGNRDGKGTMPTHHDITLTDNDIEEFISPIENYYQKGYRQNLALGLAGLMYKGGIDLENAKKLIVALCHATNDEEKTSRLAALSGTYSKGQRGEEIAGASLVSEVLTGFLDAQAANDILNNITRVWSKYKNPILMQLQDHIRQELQPHVVEIICYTPLVLVVAHSHKKQILYARVEYKESVEAEPLKNKQEKKEKNEK